MPPIVSPEQKPAPLPGSPVAPASSKEAPETNSRKKFVIIGAVIALIAGAFLVHYILTRNFEKTDDAFIEGRIVQVSPKIDGYIEKLLVSDNQQVETGDVLLEIDSRGLDATVANATAAVDVAKAKLEIATTNAKLMELTTASAIASAQGGVAMAEAEISASKSQVAQSEADEVAAAASLEVEISAVNASKAEQTRAAQDLERFEKGGEGVSPTQLDLARSSALATEAMLQQSEHKVALAEATRKRMQAATQLARDHVRESEARLVSAKAQLEDANAAPQRIASARASATQAAADLKQAQAALQTAELDLGYSTIKSPIDGRVTNRQIEQGNYLQKGQALFAIVSDDLWVTANFKETQLRDMKPGQEATISVDAFGVHDLHGKVDSIQAGTGSRFSLLPAENATGNFIKVVQRVPVKIVFTDDERKKFALGPGMSVIPSVRVR